MWAGVIVIAPDPIMVPLPDLDPIQSFGISIQTYSHTWSFQLVPFILIYFWLESDLFWSLHVQAKRRDWCLF